MRYFSAAYGNGREMAEAAKPHLQQAGETLARRAGGAVDDARALGRAGVEMARGAGNSIASTVREKGPGIASAIGNAAGHVGSNLLQGTADISSHGLGVPQGKIQEPPASKNTLLKQRPTAADNAARAGLGYRKHAEHKVLFGTPGKFAAAKRK